MPVELFHSPYCPACRALQQAFGGDLEILLRDVARDLEEAACLGITQLPALVVDRQVIAQGAAVVAAMKQLRKRSCNP